MFCNLIGENSLGSKGLIKYFGVHHLLQEILLLIDSFRNNYGWINCFLVGTSSIIDSCLGLKCKWVCLLMIWTLFWVRLNCVEQDLDTGLKRNTCNHFFTSGHYLIFLFGLVRLMFNRRMIVGFNYSLWHCVWVCILFNIRLTVR